MPSLGSTSCTPVGVSSCPSGFVAAAGGWGCDAVLPATACSGATIESLGSTTCQPMPGCDAPFPPPGASLFVSAAYTQAQLDATHFRTLGDALAAASSGATIAVDSGTYSEAIAPTSPVTVIGRCAANVVFQPPTAMAGGILLNGASPVRFANLTLQGFLGGVAVFGGSLELDSVVVQDSKYVGAAVANTGSQLTLSGVAVRGTTAAPGDTQTFGLFVGNGGAAKVTGSVFAGNQYINAGVAGQPAGGASLEMDSTVVRDGKPFGAMGYGWGVYASGQVTVSFTHGAIVDNTGVGLSLYGTGAQAPTKGSLVDSVVRRTGLDPQNPVGFGAQVVNGTLDVKNTTIADSAIVDLFYAQGGSGTVTDGTLVGSPDATTLGPIGLEAYDANVHLQGAAIVNTRVGAQIQAASVAKIDGSLIEGTKTSPAGYYQNGAYIGVGLFVETKAQASVSASAVLGAHTAGVIALGQLTAQGLVVSGTRAGGDGVGGRGFSIQRTANATIQGSAIVDNVEAGLVVMNGSPVLSLTDSVIDRTGVDASGRYGIGVLLGGGSTGTIVTTTIRGSQSVAVVASAAGGSVGTSVVTDNTVGVYVNDGTSLVQDGDAGPRTLSVSSDTMFVGNTTNVGSGVIPLPSGLVGP